MNNNEREGLELVQTAIQSGMNFRELKKWLANELTALDAEHEPALDWPSYDH